MPDVFGLSDRLAVMKNGRLVGTYRTADVTEDEVLGMIIAGKRPEGKAQAEHARHEARGPGMNTIGDQQLVKRINRSVLLRLLRARPGLSRARLAAESGLTKSTVSLLVRELLDDGWLDEAGAAVADGLGRPSIPLQINDGVRALIGVEIAIEVVRVVCVSLLGEVLHAEAQPLDEPAPRAVCAQVARMVSAAHRHLLASGLRLSGIGVGVPGAVDDATGLVRFAPNLGWRDVSLLPELASALAARRPRGRRRAVAERCRRGRARRVRVLGRRGRGPADLRQLRRRRRRRHRAERPPVHRRAAAWPARSATPSCRSTARCAPAAAAAAPRPSSARARWIARRGDAQRAADFLGVLLQNLWVTFEPRAIVVGGKSCQAHPEFLRRRDRDRAALCAKAPACRRPWCAPRATANWAPAVGAAALALHEYLRPLHPNSEARRERAAAADSAT